MSQAVEIKRKRRWRRRTWILILSGLTIVVSLLYWDHVALLYILSTLAVTVLLLVVAFSDLNDREEELINAPEADEQAATCDIEITDGPATQIAPERKKRKKAR